MQEETPKNINEAELPDRPDQMDTDAELESLRQTGSLRVSRIIVPIILGLAVVGYLMWKNFDPEEFSKIRWGTKAAVWMAIGLAFLVLRHLSYSYRLWILAEGSFKFSKCIELIFIWLFSSAVTPTSVGGSAVALIMLAKEKLSSARTAVIVLYTVVTDTFFFILSLPLLYLLLGPTMLRPDLTSVFDIDHWGKTFLIGYLVMFIYGSFFAWGLFIDPHGPRKLLDWITKGKVFRKFRKQALETGHEFVEASRDIVRRTRGFHIRIVISTVAAWAFRFGLLICIILALVPGATFDVITQVKQLARIESMFVIMEFSPTPGGSGIAEYALSNYLTDYIPAGIVLIVAFIWRLLEYYSYLLIGAVVVPNWIRKVYKRSRKEKEKVKADLQA